MLMKKTLIALAIVATAASSFSAAQVVESIVVRVGDRIITRTQYMKRLREGFYEIDQSTPADKAAAKKDEFRKNLVNDLISELLIKDRADRLNLTVTEADTKEAISRLKQQYGITTDAQFEESLKTSGMNRSDMEARLRDTLLTNKVFARELRNREDLSDKELRARYDREKEHYRLPERAKLFEIIIPRPDDAAAVAHAGQLAQEIAEKARMAPDFAKFAVTVPENAVKDKGGDLGEVARGELLPDLDKAVFNATTGTVLGPIATKSGWHIIKVELRLASEVPAFESVKDKLRKDVSDEAFQRDYKAYIENLRKDAYIEINEKNIPSV